MGFFGISGKNSDELQKLKSINSARLQDMKEMADKMSQGGSGTIYSGFTKNDESAWIFMNGVGDILKNVGSALTQEGAIFVLKEHYAMPAKRAKEIHQYLGTEPPLAKKG